VAGNTEDHSALYVVLANTSPVGPTLPGDYNGNGTVDAADYVVWRKTLGTSMPNYTGADGNGNGVVDQDDHAVWRAQFGETLSVGAGSLVAAAPTVPEPATAVLFGAGLVAVCGTIFHRSLLRRTRHRANQRHAVRRARFEALEVRCLLSFTPSASYAVGGAPIGMQSGDFNGDGIPDLATANSGGVSVLLSNGDGTFQPAHNTSTNERPSLHNALALGDFNQDGKLDLATSANGPGSIGFNVLLGRGDGTFVNAPPSPVFLGWTSSIITGDLNGNGGLDLVVAADDPFNGTTYVRVLNGQGDGTFSQSGLYVDGPAESYSLALADFDSDNQLDLVLGGTFTTWVILRTSDSYFQAPCDLGLIAESLAVADVNTDGKPDLATTMNNSVSVLLGNGDGSFETARPFTATGGSVAAADVNGDHALDLVLAGGSVLLGTGDGNFRPPITTAGAGSYLVVADFNGDGRPDEALTHTNTSTTVTILLNDGVWQEEPGLPGDYNRNGAVDAADYVVWRKTQGTTVTPSTGADGNGDGAVDQDDYGEWREHFGQTSPPSAAGNATIAAAESNLSSLQVSDAKLAVELRGASEIQRAKTAREIAFVDLAAPLTKSHAEIRHTLRTSSAATASFEDSRRNSALLSWLSQADSEPAIGTWPKGKMVEFDQTSQVSDSVLETVDGVFAQIISDWTAASPINSTAP
jgi:hypothetical protein